VSEQELQIQLLQAELGLAEEERDYWRQRVRELKHERDCFRAVLKGAEYREIDSIPQGGVALAFELGVTVSQITKAALSQIEARAV
jgi:hypothetical protein